MKCLVTGGCGFIGSHLVDRLAELGHSVVALDDLSTGAAGMLNPAAALVRGSVADYAAVSAAMAGADCVFHTAAWARVQRSIDDPLGTHNVNVNGTLNVLQAAREHGVGRVVYSSSSSVYGDQPTPVMREGMTPNPKSPYALHKLIGERYADMFADLFGMRIASLRYFNVYGARQPSDGAYALVIPRFMRLRAEGKPLTVYGDGRQTRDYTHVDDVVRANLLAAECAMPDAAHVVLNVGAGAETSVNDIAAMIGGEVSHIIPNPRGEYEERRKRADCSKAKAAIGWEARVALADGIAALLNRAEDGG